MKEFAFTNGEGFKDDYNAKLFFVNIVVTKSSRGEPWKTTHCGQTLP